MDRVVRHSIAAALGTALLAVTLLPADASAQGGPGFLFKRPHVLLSIRGGYAVPRAGSDVFRFTEERLTVSRHDFDAAAVEAELAYSVADRVDLALGVGYSSRDARSEFRDWVGTDDQPIRQMTRFSRLPVTLSAKYYLRDRGRAVSRFAWVPEKWAPYVGAGGGWLWYRFRQEGEFVDFETLDIFPDLFESSGFAPTAHILGGIELALGAQFVLSLEGRYSWGSVSMDQDFVDFDRIDLAGFQSTVGLGIRF